MVWYRKSHTAKMMGRPFNEPKPGLTGAVADDNAEGQEENKGEEGPGRFKRFGLATKEKTSAAASATG